jgi:hypothetical protein
MRFLPAIRTLLAREPLPGHPRTSSGGLVAGGSEVVVLELLVDEVDVVVDAGPKPKSL